MRRLIKAWLRTPKMGSKEEEVRYNIADSSKTGRFGKNVIFGKKMRHLSRRTSEIRVQIIGNEADDDHCILELDRSHNYWIKDLGSKSGTFVNGQQLEPGVKLKVAHEDVIAIGKPVGRFEALTPYSFLLETIYVEEDGTGQGFPYPATRRTLDFLTIEDVKRAKLLSKDWAAAAQRRLVEGYFLIHMRFTRGGTLRNSEILQEDVVHQTLRQSQNLMLRDVDVSDSTYLFTELMPRAAEDYIWLINENFPSVKHLQYKINALYSWQLEVMSRILTSFAPRLLSLAISLDYEFTEEIISRTVELPDDTEFTLLEELRIDVGYLLFHASQRRIKDLFVRMFKKMPNVKTLVIGTASPNITFQYIIRALEAVSGGTLNNLRKITFPTSQDSYREMNLDIVAAVAALPKGLEDLALPIIRARSAQNIEPIFRIHGMKINSLTLCFLTSMYEDQGTVNLNGLNNLESLTILLYASGAKVGPKIKTLGLPRLTSLRIIREGVDNPTNEDYDRCFPLLERRLIPSLRNLQVPQNYRDYAFFKTKFNLLEGFKSG